MSPKQFHLSKRNFEWLDIPNLLISIWGYNNKSHNACTICQQCEQWCIEIARKKWQPEFKSFDFFILQIQMQNKRFFNFGKVSSADRNVIYNIIA